MHTVSGLLCDEFQPACESTALQWHRDFLFSNPNRCLRLVSALLAEQDEEWMTAKNHLTVEP